MVSIIEVKTKKQLRCFVDYPNQLYRDVEQFVPATYGDDLEDWDRSKNPAFAYCDAGEKSLSAGAPDTARAFI